MDNSIVSDSIDKISYKDYEFIKDLKSELSKATMLIADLKTENKKLEKRLEKSKFVNKSLVGKLKDLQQNLEELLQINAKLRENVMQLENRNQKIMHNIQKKRIVASQTYSQESDFNDMLGANSFIRPKFYQSSPKSKSIEIENLCSEFIGIIQSTESLELLFVSFSSLHSFQDSVKKMDYASALKTLLTFTKEAFDHTIHEDTIIEQLKSENDRLDMLKNELLGCVKRSQDMLCTPNKANHARGSSFSSILFKKEFNGDRISSAKSKAN
ncbi:hypothetical protein SteCoe_29787 [Stentor coeruleus]|uniref:Uncharacterized protein n=1 Tax=Stentor coeruleus TaxID=5963 RepID=A0A1R2B537_9CILI|nr:hypothetical protein SteCoe_29787 [Stentor coeruleus]